MVDVNLGQHSVQFLPLSELFASAAESFIIMGSWYAKGKGLLRTDRAEKNEKKGLEIPFLWVPRSPIVIPELKRIILSRWILLNFKI